MNKILSYLILAVTLFVTAGCTQNDGHIGRLFGKWKLVSMEYEGTTPEYEYKGNIFWNFQSSTICMQLIEDHNSADKYGNWHLEDDTLTLTFPDEVFYPFKELGMKSRTIRLQVLKYTHSELKFIYRPTEDSSITYTLRKW